jgi:hypothetical protein
MSSPKYPTQFQHPPSPQLNKNQSFFSRSIVARVLSLITHIHLVPSLKFSAATPPLILSASMAHNGKFYFTFTSYLCTSPIGHILSCLIKVTFYTLLTSYLHTS